MLPKREAKDIGKVVIGNGKVRPSQSIQAETLDENRHNKEEAQRVRPVFGSFFYSLLRTVFITEIRLRFLSAGLLTASSERKADSGLIECPSRWAKNSTRRKSSTNDKVPDRRRKHPGKK